MKPQTKLSDFTLFRRVLRQAKPFWPYFAVIFFLDLVATPLALLLPVPLKIAVDSVIGAAPLPGVLQAILPAFVYASKQSLLFFVVIMQVLIVLLLQLQSLCSYYLRTRVGEGMTLNFRARLFHQLQRLSLIFHDTRGTADSIYRVQWDAPSLQWLTLYGIMPLLSAVVMLLSMVFVIVSLNWQLALVALTIIPPLYLYSSSYNRRMRPFYKQTKQLESSALRVVQEVLSAIRVVKTFGREEDEEQRFIQHSTKNVKAKTKLALAEGGLGLLVNLTTGLGAAAVLLLGVMSVQSGALTVGGLLMVITYLGQVYGPLQTISKQVANFQTHLASAQRAFEILDERQEVIEKPGARPLKRASGAVEFRDVTFAYDEKHPVLKNISFRITPGTRLGLQGKTGSGKSTLVSLLCRLYDPQSGQILVDGVDLRDYKLADLRSQFAIMLQEPVLFSTSITENISYAQPGVALKEIEAAARAANAHDFIIGLPDGYDTLVGERGMRLSGGERQRISLARAFLKDAPILILDEPTSSVDLKTEAGIMETMERLMHGRTTFMIAHRLSTLENCDELLIIEDGQLVTLTLEAKTATKEARMLGKGS